MKKHFDPKNKRLIFFMDKSTPAFWDRHWKTKDFRSEVENGKRENLVSRTTRTYIAPRKDRRILEGGCGRGQYVYSLDASGYDAYGIDYAENTVKKTNELFPGLKIAIGDVEKLDFPDAYFDGYWSLGVIEHFWDGYDKITNEMGRIIKPGGFLFITFPYMSPLRKLKARLGMYPESHQHDHTIGNFYQFALDDGKVTKDLRRSGFRLIGRKPFDGVKGMKDEIGFLKPFLQKIYDGRNVALKVINMLISIMSSSFASHSILLIFRKDD